MGLGARRRVLSSSLMLSMRLPGSGWSERNSGARYVSFGGLISSVTKRDVIDFVRDDPGQLSLVFRGGDCSRVDIDESARQRESVYLARGDDVELVREFI